MGFAFNAHFGALIVHFALMGIGIGNYVTFANEQSTEISGTTTAIPMPKFSQEFLTHSDPPPSGGNVYYGENDGLCGWWNAEAGAYEKPTMNYTSAFEAQADFEDGVTDGEELQRFCLYQFHQAAMQPACGEAYYSYIKYCAMVQFYQNQMPHPIEKEEEKDLMLVMVDGCLICKEGNASEVKVALVNEWPAGSTFTSCAKEQRTPDWFEVSMNNAPGYFASQFNNTLLMPESVKETPEDYKDSGSTSFAFPLILYQRRCEGMFSEDPEVNIYTGLKLMVKHNCGGSEATMEVNLADIDPSKFQNNMVELRGMMLLLGENKWFQYRMESYTYLSENELKEFEFGEDNTKGQPIYDNVKDDDDYDEEKKRRRRRK